MDDEQLRYSIIQQLIGQAGHVTDAELDEIITQGNKIFDWVKGKTVPA
jgi:hypothetical protein